MRPILKLESLHKYLKTQREVDMLDEATTRYIKSKQKEAALEAINDANINFIIEGQGHLQNQNDSQDSLEVEKNEV